VRICKCDPDGHDTGVVRRRNIFVELVALSFCFIYIFIASLPLKPTCQGFMRGRFPFAGAFPTAQR
jgi:hypothetical protein